MTQVRAETIRLVGGERLEGTPPGAAVLTPPLHPAAEREGETFVLLLDLAGADVPSRLYREIREAAAQTFWSTQGGVTAALRRAVIAANRVLFGHNSQVAPGQRCQGALSCGALKASELFLTQAGPAWACLLSGDTLEQFPKEDLAPLGNDTYVEMRLAYVPVRQGDTLVMASQSLARSVSSEALRRILRLSETHTILDSLEQVAGGEDLAALVLRWSDEEAAAAPPPPRRRRPATPAPPPEETPPPVESRPRRESVPLGEPAIPPEGRRTREEPTSRRWEMVELEEDRALPYREPEPLPYPRRPSRPPLARRLRLGDRARGLGRGVAAAAAGVGSGVRTIFRRALPGAERDARVRPRRERRPPPAENPRVMLGVTLGILALVAALTLQTWIAFGSRARRDQTFTRAREHAAQAEQAATPEDEHGHWEAVLTTLAGTEDDPEAVELVTQARLALDRLDNVIRVDPIPLRDFDSGLSVRRLVVRGPNLFMLDTGHQEVDQLTLAETGDQVLGETIPTILKSGEELGGQDASAPLDMAWDAASGEWTADRLVILDTNSRLWVYDPAWPDNTYPLSLGPAPGQRATVAMAAFDGRLYLLDPQAGQIWRHWPRSEGYPDPAGPYFPTGGPQSLESARDMAIDGNVYVLFSDGGVAKYFDGEAVPYEVTGVPAPSPRFVALTVDPEVADGPVYLADAADERLVVLDSGGAYRAQLRAASGVLRNVQALAIDDTGGRLHLFAEGRLYAVPIPPLP